MKSSCELARRLAANERAAFVELLDGYGARIERLASRYSTSRSDAEDLTQEIFLDIFRCAAGFRGDSEFSTWIYRIALNHCLKHQQKSQREATLHAQTDADVLEAAPDALHHDPANRAASGELSAQVQEAMGNLSLVHRDVIVLHELHGLTYTQCAEILDVPVGTVKSRLSNAFRALRTALGPYVLGDAENPATPSRQALGEPS